LTPESKLKIDVREAHTMRKWWL